MTNDKFLKCHLEMTKPACKLSGCLETRDFNQRPGKSFRRIAQQLVESCVLRELVSEIHDEIWDPLDPYLVSIVGN